MKQGGRATTQTPIVGKGSSDRDLLDITNRDGLTKAPAKPLAFQRTRTVCLWCVSKVVGCCVRSLFQWIGVEVGVPVSDVGCTKLSSMDMTAATEKSATGDYSLAAGEEGKVDLTRSSSPAERVCGGIVAAATPTVGQDKTKAEKNVTKFKTTQKESDKLAELKAKKMELKQQLKDYDMRFETKHGRMPTKAEKEPIRHMYTEYNELKRKILEASIPKVKNNNPHVATLKAERTKLHRKLRIYEKDFVKEHKRNVASFADIRPMAAEYRRFKVVKKKLAALAAHC